jgi:uridine kinase
LPGTPDSDLLSVTVPIILPVYSEVVAELTPVLRRSPGAIVTIDGRDGVGKTTLGRYLAWHFSICLIETDLFLIPARDHLIHLDDQINRIIERRVSSSLPVVVEGISILQIMKRIHRVSDFSIYVTNPRRSSDKSMERRLSTYEAAFSPSTIANLVVKVDTDGVTPGAR